MRIVDSVAMWNIILHLDIENDGEVFNVVFSSKKNIYRCNVFIEHNRNCLVVNFASAIMEEFDRV